VVLLAIATACLCESASVKSFVNPMSRVADLLENLAKKKESDAKLEEDLWEKYVCWYKTVVSTKKQTNKMAKDRITALEGYIDDIEGGKIEFTNERETLEKATADLTAEIDKATELRNKENEDFEAAKDEMEKAISSLEKAVEVLGEATKDMKEGELLAMRSDLKQALHVGQTFLAEEDASLLEKALEEPESALDWKKMADDKTFNSKYKARSSKIQEILADMLQTFKDNLEDATKKEQDTKTSFDTLMTSKNEQLDAASDALGAKNEESGTRNLRAQEAKDERDMLKTQVEADEKFIKQADDSYAAKNSEWKERQRLRTAEMASITEALSVLRSDDARDLSKKSFSSQGGFFLQEKDGCARKARAKKAMTILRHKAKKHQDMRLTVLASMLQVDAHAGGKFDKVEKAIDKMISDLHDEEDEDLETKEHCEADRMENTKVAKKKSQEIDDKTAFITRKNAQIAELKAKIANVVKNIKDLQAQIAEAKANRDAENHEFEAAKQDDVAAASLVQKTMDVLKKFYEDEGLALTQQKVLHKRASEVQAPTVTAGEAPPPPPPTWSDGGYAGSPGESNGIQAILQMIKDDIEKDIRDATAIEDKSQQNFDDFKSDTEDTIGTLEGRKSEYEGEVGDKEGDIEVAKGERSDKKKILDDTMAYLKTIAPSCDYMAVNFELRKENRAEEIEGLAEAKAALQGGSFSFLQKQQPDDDDCDGY